MNKVKILNLEIDNLSKIELLDKLRSGVVFTPNVDHLMKLQEDPEFLQAYSISDYKVCDSQILLYASKFLGTPIKEKISGSDLFPAFYNYHKNNQNIKIFLLGAGIGVASKAQNEINRKTGRNIIVASYSPPFGFEKDEQECQNIINMINSSGATVLAIGVGAPKQEKWIYKYKNMLPHIKIFMAVGATIDFEAGNLKRSPKWMSEVGFEWLFRIFCDPKRLWKRYLVDDIPFLILVLKQKLKFSITKEHKKKNPMSANC
ncbi:WecB/TagA/CpsF family glycosyltransferase [Brasilonema sp. CT11]|nr:WecB/TagA/CpsF family glycosyltransferase [Brasilonema sp. CT11]